tara:strand:+ start:576 stop:1592 length:1017 start_codon:yes stop_codon:yes gene_type:complete
MTVTRYDLKTSEATSEDWGAHSHSRVFRTSDDTDSKTALEIRDLIAGGAGYGGIIAKTGGRLMVDSVIQGDPARVRTVQVRLVAEGLNTAEITVGLTEYARFTGEKELVRVLSNHTMSPTPMYRTKPIVPTDVWSSDTPTGYYNAAPGIWSGATASVPPLNTLEGTVDATTGVESSNYRPPGDIDGTMVDWNGNPLSVGITQIDFTVEVVRQGVHVSNLGTSTGGDQTILQDTAGIGTRNQATFAGLAQGTTIYMGVQRVALDAEWYLAKYQFRAREDKHAKQVPRPTFGTRIGAMSYEGDPRSIRHIRGVYWQQPYLRGTDFNDLFTTDEQALIALA